MIIFTKGQKSILLKHAEKELPFEACGVIAGTISGEEKRVAKIYECANVDPDPEVGYEISPAELLRVMEDSERLGLSILGFYHSHPMALDRPSMVDEHKATWPGHSYVIVSPKTTPAITSWVWVEGEGFAEEEIVVK